MTKQTKQSIPNKKEIINDVLWLLKFINEDNNLAFINGVSVLDYKINEGK